MLDSNVTQAISAFVGGILGILVSIIVNCTLVEISINAFFSVYFGVLFMIVGFVILWRVYENSNMQQTETKRQYLIAFALAIIISGILCFILEKNWFIGLGAAAKVPLYAILGIAVSFALVFSIVDLLNFFIGFCQQQYSKPIVETPTQIYLIIGVSILMGLCFGFIFGLLDVEDESFYHLRFALLKEEHYCYPIGFILGAAAGWANEKLRNKCDIDCSEDDFASEI